MLVFELIAVGGFLLVVGGYIFGHDHEVDHDVDHDTDHGDTHDMSHAEPTVSFFSTKVIGTLIMGFGAGGALARYADAGVVVSSMTGLGSGILLALLMLLLLKYFYKQQSTSIVPTASAIGMTGVVTISIDEDATGEVGVTVGGQYQVYSARSSKGNAISKGRSVKIVSVRGSTLLVEDVRQ